MAPPDWWDSPDPTGPHGVPPVPPAPWPDAPRTRSPRQRAFAVIAAVAAVALLAGTAAGVRVIGRATDDARSGVAGVPTDDTSPDGRLDNGFGLPSSAAINVHDVAKAVSPAVVNISATLSIRTQTAGSGLVIAPSGLVLTNNHVINGAIGMTVEVGVTGKKYSAHVLGYDVGDDVALLQLEDASNMKTIKTASSSSVATRDPVVAIGNALGRFGTPSAVPGTVTGLHQPITAGDGAEKESLPDTIRFAGSIRPGDSGGALVNADGRVIGMNTAADPGRGRLGSTSGTTGFAIPIEAAVKIAGQIRAGDETGGVHVGRRALLGIGLSRASEDAPFADDGTGAGVSSVGPDTPADDIGLSEGDTIVRVDDRPITSNDDLRATLDRHHPGDRVVVRWIDADGGAHRATVTLDEGPPA